MWMRLAKFSPCKIFSRRNIFDLTHREKTKAKEIQGKMGAVCSCFRAEGIEEYMNPNSPVYRNCPCLRCLVHNFLNLYISLFQRGETRSLPSSVQAAASMASSASLDDSLSDTYRSPPRPLPYDADPRYYRSQRDSLVSRREKGSSHSHEESQPLRSDNDVDSESFTGGGKWLKRSVYEEASTEEYSKSSLRISQSKGIFGFENMDLSSEDEDICPTCLEEYTSENPKMMTKCSHHFHLGCIYEWLERSENCPVCGKVMAFDETP